ncbi:reverse transcriptase domain-containing protein [Tanacetum coccineum]
MRTRSQTRNRNRQQQAQPAVVQPFHLEEPFVNPPLVPMADNRTMAQLLQAPTEGYEDAIVIPEINANFELKHGLINLVQNKQFFGLDKEDPHAHIRYFNKITSTMRFPDIPSTSIKLMLFPFSLEGSARIWLEKEPPRSILTWDDLVSKFINQFFPPLKTTNLRNEITRFQQRFDESFYEAWDRFNDLLRACPHHGFLELHQLDTFYNALNANDQDSLNSAAGGNFLDKMPRECLRIIESKSKVRNSRNKAVVAKVSSNSSTPGISPDVAALTTEVSELKNMMKTMLIDKQKAQAPAPVKAVEQSCVTCGGAHSYKNCPATDGNVYQDNIQEYVSQAAAANFNQGNTNSRPPMVSNQIRPPGFPPIQNNQNCFNQNQGNNFNQNRGTNFNQNRGSNFNQGQVYQPPTIQPPVYQAPPQQMQGVSKTDFENYVKANDAVLRNMQNQGQGTLPSQTVTNPREHVNAITTRSGKTCEGPSTPLVPTPVVSTPIKEPEQNPEPPMDKVQKPSSENTAQVPLPEDHDFIFIEIPKPKAKKTVSEPNSLEPNSYQPKLPYPERMKVREKDKPVAQPSSLLFEFDDNFTSSNVNPLFNETVEDVENENSNVSDSDEPVLLNTPLTDKVECFAPEDDIDEIDAFLAMKVSSNFEEGYFKQNESSITFSPRSDPLHHEFAGELITLPSRIVREHEDYLNRMTLLCEISTSRSQENVHANPSSIIESLPTSLIPVEDNDPVQEEIDIFLVPDDLIPPGVENDDSEDEDNELPNLDHQDNPSSPRPPPEPPDDEPKFSEDSRVRCCVPDHSSFLSFVSN